MYFVDNGIFKYNDRNKVNIRIQVYSVVVSVIITLRENCESVIVALWSMLPRSQWK